MKKQNIRKLTLTLFVVLGVVLSLGCMANAKTYEMKVKKISKTLTSMFRRLAESMEKRMDITYGVRMLLQQQKECYLIHQLK